MPTAQRYAELERLRHEVPDVPERVLGQVRLTSANLAFEIGRTEEGLEHASAAATIFTSLGDRRLCAWARYFEAMGRWTFDSEREQVASVLDEALSAFDELQDDFGLAYTLWPSSLLAADVSTARARNQRSEALFRQLGARFGLGHCLEGRALIELAAGEPGASCTPIAEALKIFSEADNLGCTAHALEATAAMLVERGDLLRRRPAGRCRGRAAAPGGTGPPGVGA